MFILMLVLSWELTNLHERYSISIPKSISLHIIDARLSCVWWAYSVTVNPSDGRQIRCHYLMTAVRMSKLVSFNSAIYPEFTNASHNVQALRLTFWIAQLAVKYFLLDLVMCFFFYIYLHYIKSTSGSIWAFDHFSCSYEMT